MKRTRTVVCCLFLLLALQGVSQNYSNKGRDFYITYPIHIDGPTSVMGIYITSDKASTGTIEVGGQSIPFTLAANSVVRKFIGPNGDASNGAVYLTAQDGITAGAAIHITSDNPVAVYAHIIKTSRSGASLIFPTTVWGKQYVVPSYSNSGSQGGTAYGIPAITVVAAEANTTVQITPTAATRSGKPAGPSFQVTLVNPGDVYQVQFQQNSDISGTTVQSVSTNGSSCKKIAVFSSTSWSAFGCGNSSQSGDNLYQQLFPTASWGKSFLTSPAKTRVLDIYRVFVSDPQAVVTKTENGIATTLTGLIKNSYYEFTTGNPTLVQSDKPSSVVQYFTTQACQAGASIGDPEMVVLNPVEQTINNITVFSAHKSWVPANQSAVDHCYLNIIIKTNATASFRINGSAPAGNFAAISGTAFSYLQEDVTLLSATNPVQTLTADSSFSAIAYGFGSVESYGYNAGTNVQDFSAQPAFQTDYARIDSAVTCANTPFRFSVPISFQPTTIKWDFSAAPNISPTATQTLQPVQDSAVNGVYYYSPQGTFVFSNANTAALRDTIKLYTTSATPDGCGSTDQLFAIPVKVNERPVAKFAVMNSGCISDSVKFTDQSIYSGKLVRWEWNMGDGMTDTRISADTFAKKYTSGGSYTVKLKVYTEIGCVSPEISQVLDISAKPVAKFNVPTLLCPDADISFTDASGTGIGTLTSWQWGLDDGAGTISNTTNASVKTKYTSPGIKHVWLLVATNTGCQSDTFMQAVKINALPIAGFRVPEVCWSDASAGFTDTSTIAEGTIASYAWNFNAGTTAVTPGPQPATSNLQNPQPKYNKADHYKVSLMVTSDKGCAASSVQDFTVNGSVPKADFVFAGITPYCGAKPVQVINQSTVDFGGVTKLELYWDNAGSPSVSDTDEDPLSGKAYAHSYTAATAAKQYSVRMLAYSGGTSCVSELTKTVTVYPQPEAAYSVSASQLCEGSAVQFTDNSKAGAAIIASWRWDLGRNNIVTQQNPSYRYNDSGSIATSLVVTTTDGCASDTTGMVLTVYPNPKLQMPATITVLEGAIATVKPISVYGNNLAYLWTPATYIVGASTLSEVKVSPPADQTIDLLLTAEGGCTATGTTLIKVLRGLEIPNGFSPNGDGIYDTWHIRYLDGYPAATVEVYNRGGQIVFRSVGYSNDWDGTYQGKPLPIGTYYYIINPRAGKAGIYTGSVTIIK